MNADRSIGFVLSGFIGLALVLIGFVAWNEKQAAAGSGRITAYAENDPAKPVASAAVTSKDIGKMKVTEEKTVDFVIKNTGRQPLQLYNLNSSCGCTAAQVTVGDSKSPEVSMHQKNDWNSVVAPGQEAVVSLIYRPQIMPVRGEVTRSVYVDTNDPSRPQLTFNIKVFVE